MKRTLYNLIIFVILIAPLVWINCGTDNPNPLIDLSDPSTFPGTYKLISITETSGEDLPAGLTIQAGEPTSVTIGGDAVILTVTGTLTLTESRYTFSITIKVAISGFPEQTETETDTGTYSVSGSTMTIVSDDPEEGTQTFTISASANEMTLEDDDSKLVFEKQ